MVGVFSLLTPRRILLAFAVLLIAAGVAGRFAVAAESAGPSASFTFDPGAPLSSEQITFTSTSSDDGTIVSEEWDFDDGATGSGAVRPAHYPRSRRLHGAADGHRRREPDRHPHRGRHGRQPQPERRLPLLARGARGRARRSRFTSDATDPEGRIDVQRWDLDDDGSYDATGASASKVFTSGGPHTVTLRVEDKDGGTDTISKTIDVIDPPNQSPNAAFNFIADRPDGARHRDLHVDVERPGRLDRAPRSGTSRTTGSSTRPAPRSTTATCSAATTPCA